MSEGFWWIALAVATLSAAAHLASMLGTRWGDRAASSKAFLFSLLAHLSLFCGLFAVGPELERFARKPEETEATETPLQVREVLSDSFADSETPDPGETPLWDQPAQTAAPLEDRLVREFELPPNQETARTIDQFEPRDREIPVPVELPAESVAAPETVTPTAERLAERAAEMPDLPEETAEAREVESPAIARANLTPSSTPSESENVERSALPPSAARLGNEIDLRSQPLELPPSEGPAELARVETDSDPLKAETPTAPVPLPEAEVAGAEGEEEASAGDAGMIQRIRRRSVGESVASTPSVEERRVSPSETARRPPDGVELSSTDRIGPSPIGVPSLSRPEATPLQERRENAVPETYQLRALERRTDVARRNGGTEASEQAVELSLKWLAAHQNPAGYWDADKYDAGQVEIDEEGINRQNAGKTADSGLTALALLAFLGAGYTQDEGEYAETIDKALTWLIANQREDGFLGGDAAHFEQMYCHGMATYALAEAYGMQADATNVRLRRPLFNAVLYIASQQGEDGGWRYVKGQAGDMSMFGWQLMALKSADIAGIPMPGTTRSKMIRFLKDRSLGESGGLAAYREGLKPTAPMTAEALFCKQMLGMTRTNPASLEAVSYLLKSPPKRSELNYYYWYYGTLAMFQYGGTDWDRWNQSLRDLLIAEQIKTGDDAGSWAPKDAWGPYGGRIYSTAIATLSLEVYYRFLPLYRAGDADDANSSGSAR